MVAYARHEKRNKGTFYGFFSNFFQNRLILKPAGLLKRDSRQVERKKFGLKKARKASQFSKR